MSIMRARKEASRKIAIELKRRYDRLVTAPPGDENEIVIATTDLAVCFNENIEFILWALGTFGGMTNIPYPERIKPQRPPAKPLPGMPDISALTSTFAEDEAPKFLQKCTCPPLEPGIITGHKHMTSCPQFAPGN
jgi:hypothetical protein